jgi:hypothetical protein
MSLQANVRLVPQNRDEAKESELESMLGLLIKSFQVLKLNNAGNIDRAV